jgi:FAD dependent oxidoreductase
MMAAWTAAHHGAHVALVEANTTWGGAVQHGMHRWLCGLFPCDVQQPLEFLHGEGVERFCRLLVNGDPRSHAVRRGRVWLLPIRSGEAFSQCAQEMLASETSLDLFTHSPVITADCATTGQKRISAVQLQNGATLGANVFIDCTGKASLCQMAGAAVKKADHPALAGFGFEVEGIEASAVSSFGLAIDVPKVCRQGVESGLLPGEARLTTCEGSSETGCALIRMAVSATIPPDKADLLAYQLFHFLKDQLPAFKSVQIRRCLSVVLPREGTRLHGIYHLTGDDVLAARRFGDAVARNSWPIERWDPDQGIRYAYLPAGNWHEIPSGCLQPRQGPKNLLGAGMMISADSQAQASIRVIGTCMATGEAAGKMAVQKSL